MKRLLFPLLAALALPTAVNAESYWLILTFGTGSYKSAGALEKVEMPSLEVCKKEGNEWVEKGITSGFKTRFFHCITGK